MFFFLTPDLWKTLPEWLEPLELLEAEPSLTGMVRLTESGLTNASILAFVRRSNLPQRQVAHWIDLSERTIQRDPRDKVLRRSVADRLLGLAQLFMRGEEVFGEVDRFNAWLGRPNAAFGGKEPGELLGSTFGISWVHDELTRLEHGVVA